jgi:transposase
MLRLLKSGHCRSLSELASRVHYSTKQVERWWKSYQQGGITKLLERRSAIPGRPTRISAEAWAALQQQMIQGEIGSLEDARRYLEQQWQIDYSIGGVSNLFKRRKVKLKTGRRRHRQSSVEEQTTFKK